MTRGILIGEIIDNLSNLNNQITLRCSLGFTDLNKVSEDFFAKLLNQIYSYNLSNLNATRSNEPGLDIGDESKFVAFQVTSQADSAKINNTLENIRTEQQEKFKLIKILIIGEKQGSYTAINPELIEKFQHTKSGKLEPENFIDFNLVDIKDLLRDIITLDFKLIHTIYKFIKEESEEVRNFIREAQTKCNILITSRIGLGELEYPRKLNGLSESESAKLIREIARIRNSDTLLKLPQKTLVDISSKLYFNPLAIKWFVSTVESGIAPHEVLNNKEDLLDFCLTNVYEKLSEGAISILKTIRAARKKITNAEVIYLSDYEPLEVRKYLIELFKTTLISRQIEDGNNYEEVIYYISDFAKDFLSKKYPIDEAYIKANIRKSKELNVGIRQINKVQKYNEFSLNALVYDNQNQMISAKFLQEALQCSKSGNFDQALSKVHEAKNIDPNYFEVYRVGAFIKATQGDLLSAEEDYQLGLEIAPNNPRLLFYYAQFLMFKLEDVDGALEYAKRVYDQKPNHPYTTFLIARCFNTAQEFNKAIQVVKDLKASVELDPKNLRIANTELISYYAEIGKSLLTIQTDTDNGISHFKKAFELFEKCAKEKIVDYKMAKNFSVGILTLIRIIPVVKIEEIKSYINKLILENDRYINLTVDLKEKIILSYKDKFADESLNSLIDFESEEQKLVGNLKRTKNPKDNFAFIDSNSESYFAHRYDFIDVANWTDWKTLKNGQLVSFEKGINNQGECAKAIKLI